MDKNWKQWDKMMKGADGMFGKQKDISFVAGKNKVKKKRKQKKGKKRGLPKTRTTKSESPDFSALLGKKPEIWGKKKLGLW